MNNGSKSQIGAFMFLRVLHEFSFYFQPAAEKIKDLILSQVQIKAL